jgi:hypothetical protein
LRRVNDRFLRTELLQSVLHLRWSLSTELLHVFVLLNVAHHTFLFQTQKNLVKLSLPNVIVVFSLHLVSFIKIIFFRTAHRSTPFGMRWLILKHLILCFGKQ